MGIVRISDNVYSTGVINPSLRIFDIIMEAKYGTSYNSYLVTGDKNVLIDTAHAEYSDEYFYNLQCLIDIKDIDYIVMNHTEPDHSGSLAKLIEMNPEIKVVCTAAAKKYLSGITNLNFNCITVKDGDTIDTGRGQLKFIVAPFLHWPDSMMTWFENEGVLFTCDFLGCHFCEPTGIDTNIHYKKEYLEEFKYYYDCIFGPFKPYVLSGLDKIKDLKIQAVCPSHGPVLTETVENCIESYRKWSQPEENPEKYIAIVYASAYGCTKALAEAAFNAVNSMSNGIRAKLIDAVSVPFNDIVSQVAGASAVMVGSCTINRDAPKIIWDVLSTIDAINTRGKPAGSFGSYGWSGEAVKMISDRLSGLGYKFVGEGIRVNFVPDSEDLKTIGKYASEVAQQVKKEK